MRDSGTVPVHCVFRRWFQVPWIGLDERVANCLDIVPVRIEYESAVIVWMIVRADAGRTIVTPACCQRCAIERIDG